VLQVPLFVNPGERIKVDTRTGEYITRPKALPDEGPRHEAREHAIALLYEGRDEAGSLPDVLAGLSVSPDPFTVALLEGVDADSARIDELVSSAAVGWEDRPDAGSSTGRSCGWPPGSS